MPHYRPLTCGFSPGLNPPPPLERLRPPWPRLFWTTLVWSDREPPGGRRAFEVRTLAHPTFAPRPPHDRSRVGSLGVDLAGGNDGDGALGGRVLRDDKASHPASRGRIWPGGRRCSEDLGDPPDDPRCRGRHALGSRPRVGNTPEERRRQALAPHARPAEPRPPVAAGRVPGPSGEQGNGSCEDERAPVATRSRDISAHSRTRRSPASSRNRCRQAADTLGQWRRRRGRDQRMRDRQPTRKAIAVTTR
jgi:hypothetical protein